jgi:hypothetical protein
LRLNIEFLAGDQVHLLENAGQHGLDVLLDIAGRRVGKQGAHLGAEFFKNLGIEHGGSSVAGQFSTGGFQHFLDRRPPLVRNGM